MAGVERNRELRRRRKRKQKIAKFKKKVASASASEKSEIARKVRRLTPGADVVINSLGIKIR